MTINPARGLRPFKPTPFGRYTLVAPIAVGGMGEIYLARVEGAHGFEKFCVIKKILAQLLQDEGFVERFVTEAKTLATLGHSSIARVLDMGVHDGEPFIALEHVDGKDLRKVISRMRERNQPPPLTFVLYVMGRVLDALAYAHRKRDENDREMGLVHRDISPQNILVSYEGEVKVIDFGLAKSTLSSNRTNPSIILGKFLYMAPEQARQQVADRRTDLYSVGLCLYELIAGKSPFDDAPTGELMQRVVNPQIPSLLQTDPLLPPAVAQMVQKALAVAPEQRFQTAEEFRGKVLSLLLEIDPAAGSEGASNFMRETFSGEFAAERKLLQAIKEGLRPSGERRSDADAPLKFATPTAPMPAVGARKSSPLVSSPSAAANWQDNVGAVTEVAKDSAAQLSREQGTPTPAAGLFGLDELGLDRAETPRAGLHMVPDVGPRIGLAVTQEDPKAQAGARPLGKSPLPATSSDLRASSAQERTPTVARSSGPRPPNADRAQPLGATLDMPGSTLDLPPQVPLPPRTEPYSRTATIALERRQLWGYLMLGMGSSLLVAALGYAAIRFVKSLWSDPKPVNAQVAPVPAPTPPVFQLLAPPPEPADAALDAGAKRAAKRPPKKLPKTSPLHKEWATAQQGFDEMVRVKPCEQPSVALLCNRFQLLRSDVEKFREDMETPNVGDEASLMARVKSMAESVAQKKRER